MKNPYNYNKLLVAFLWVFSTSVQAQASLQQHFYNRQIFLQKVEQAMERVRDILVDQRTVTLAEHQEHTYQDKFALVEFVTRTTASLLLQAWTTLGLNVENAAAEAAAGKQVVVTLETNGTIEFLQEKEIQVKASGKEEVDAIGNVIGGNRDIRYTKEYHWNVTVSYHLYSCIYDSENDTVECDKKQTLRQRTASKTIITSSKRPPKAEHQGRVATLNLSQWLRQQANQPFVIHRDDVDCKTPRRNPDVDLVLELQGKMYGWCKLAGRQLFFYTAEEKLSSYQADNVPILAFPMLQNSTTVDDDVLSKLLLEQKRRFDESIRQVNANLPELGTPGALVSTAEGALYSTLNHMALLVHAHFESVAYIEDLLQRQLEQAIGKQVQASDFEQYMNFHNRQLFGHAFGPTSFTFAVRRPNQYPVGILSLENANADTTTSSCSTPEPIHTFTRRISGQGRDPFRIPISTATQVEITGDRYLTGWVRYDFSTEPPPRLVLAARARQFSSFLLVVGTISGPDTLNPKHAIILKNKDEVKIFLNAQVLPSAKEFKDAIKSMSPEQQAFAKSFRAMSLASSVFGFCVVQLKPQLEKLLNLDDGALNKEIELTEELTLLFVDFQIPSDLLSYDGPPDAPPLEKVNTVKGYVKSVMSVIEANKKKHLEEEKMKASARKAMYETYTTSMSTEEYDDEESPAASVNSQGYQSQSGGRSAEMRYAATSRMLRGHGMASAAQTLSDNSAPGDGGHSDEPAETVQELHSSSRKVSDREDGEDFTAIPKMLDAKLEEFDTDGALRPMIVKAGMPWTRKRQENLLVEATQTTLDESDIESETKKAFDLLDAISRSGTLPIESAELHVIIGMAHGFDKSLVATVIQDNINPIAKVEQSLLMLASTIHNEPMAGLIGEPNEVDRLAATFPSLFNLPAGSTQKTLEDEDPPVL